MGRRGAESTPSSLLGAEARLFWLPLAAGQASGSLSIVFSRRQARQAPGTVGTASMLKFCIFVPLVMLI